MVALDTTIKRLRGVILNMLKILAASLSLILASALLNGCALIKSSNEQQLCTKLKREWTYHTNNPNREAAWATNAQKEQFRQKMRDNNCI